MSSDRFARSIRPRSCGAKEPKGHRTSGVVTNCHSLVLVKSNACGQRGWQVRDVRPTVKVLKMLPPDSFGDPEMPKAIQKQQWKDLHPRGQATTLLRARNYLPIEADYLLRAIEGHTTSRTKGCRQDLLIALTRAALQTSGCAATSSSGNQPERRQHHGGETTA